MSPTETFPPSSPLALTGPLDRRPVAVAAAVRHHPLPLALRDLRAPGHRGESEGPPTPTRPESQSASGWPPTPVQPGWHATTSTRSGRQPALGIGPQAELESRRTQDHVRAGRGGVLNAPCKFSCRKAIGMAVCGRSQSRNLTTRLLQLDILQVLFQDTSDEGSIRPTRLPLCSFLTGHSSIRWEKYSLLAFSLVFSRAADSRVTSGANLSAVLSLCSRR